MRSQIAEMADENTCKEEKDRMKGLEYQTVEEEVEEEKLREVDVDELRTRDTLAVSQRRLSYCYTAD